ncbi:tyrosine-type recombinase/integrase [Nocardia sp. CC201C]|uniref:tyrosine-type recombinase/integrase n=1 Tax=Nocardia sp. CC201C TaxID=3044575 RepID=UPI0024A9964A|nr:tyrosine-type recombinase/integrase [Nocardia sp. CC201C]
MIPRLERVLTPADYQAITAGIPQQWRPLTEFLAVTGVRLGEAAALTAPDIDPGAGTCRIERTWVCAAQYWEVVRARQVRTVTLPEMIIESLDLTREDEELFRVGLTFGPGLMAQYRRVWGQAVLDAGGELGRWRPRVHELRRMCGSRLLGAGIPPEVVAAQLGWSMTATVRLRAVSGAHKSTS